MGRFAIAVLLVIAAGVSARAQDFSPQDIQKLTAQKLPVPSFWVSNRGTQLKLYAYEDRPLAGTPNPHGYFRGVVNSAAAPPGCQYATFELLPKAEYVAPQIALAVDWKNWTVDCQARTIWTGILNGHTLQFSWSLLRLKPNGKIVPTKHGGTETFQQMP